MTAPGADINSSSITPTPTIQGVLSEMSSLGEVHAAEVVKKILEHHQEYASGKAREILSAVWPDFAEEEKHDAGEWVQRVANMVDHLLAETLHGRLVILGLSRLDKSLGRHLRIFNSEIAKELLEDFDSLLLPDYAGPEAYRREFLKILQNRAKHNPSLSQYFPERPSGFLLLTQGGYKLDLLAGLCFQQRYNSCLVSRYQLFGDKGLDGFIQAFMADLRGIADGDYGTIGTFLPDLEKNNQSDASKRSWHDAAKALMSATDNYQEDQSVGKTLLNLSNWSNSVLQTGERIVLFLEWHEVSDAQSPEQIGITDEVLGVLLSLPERVGIVISGLPEFITRQIQGNSIYHLQLPPDKEPRRGQKLVNDTPEGPDQLNILPEIQALADAIALKTMNPPLVVGIFGGWGSGKSFVLHLIEQQLQERRCEGIGGGKEDLENYPFVGHPYLVHFDAWTYAKGNLWASLMQTTLVELDRQLSIERELAQKLNFDLRAASPLWRLLWQLTDKQREILTKTELGEKALKIVNEFIGTEGSGSLWSELDKLRQGEKVQLQLQESELQQLQVQQIKARRELEALVDQELTLEAKRVAWMPVWEEIKDLVEDKLHESDAKSLEEMYKAIPALKKLWLGVKNLSMPAAVFMLVAILGGFILANQDSAFQWYAQVSGFVVALGAPILRAWEWFEGRNRAYENRLAIAQASKGKLRQQRIHEHIRIAETNSPGEKLATLEQQIMDTTAKVERLRAKIGITGQARSLSEFLKTRIDEGQYKMELGLLDQIQSDIQELSDTLIPKRAKGIITREATDKLFPRGDPRVIMFIDDLDRCPPDKVVEVLEAAQLLVKTQLFVVVIAIDVRYVTRALENEYKGVLVRSGEPSGLDYIEKIIQIPYRVRAASAPAVKQYLHSQMDIQEQAASIVDAGYAAADDAATATQPTGKIANDQAARARLRAAATAAKKEVLSLPSKVIRFEPEEYALLSESCSTVAISPRTMKRLVNVFKLLKIIWYHQGLEEGPDADVKKAMLSILALCAKYPEVLRKLLSEMEAFYRDKSRDLQTNLAGFLVQHCEKGAGTALYPPDWEQVRYALQDKSFFPKEMTFSRLEEINLHLLSAFSFVGETDSEREAALQRGYYRNQEIDLNAKPDPV